MRPVPDFILEMPAPRSLGASIRHAARQIRTALRPAPRRIAELTPEQRVIYAALRQGAEGGLTVSIPVSVQDRRSNHVR